MYISILPLPFNAQEGLPFALHVALDSDDEEDSDDEGEEDDEDSVGATDADLSQIELQNISLQDPERGEAVRPVVQIATHPLLAWGVSECNASSLSRVEWSGVIRYRCVQLEFKRCLDTESVFMPSLS